MILRIQLTISDEDWNFQTFKHQHQKRHGKETEERVVGMLPDRKNGIEEFREPKWNQPPWAPHHSSSRRPIHTQTHMFHNEAPLTLWNWEVSMGTFCQCPAKLTEMLATKTDTATSRNTAPAQKGHLQPPIATCYCYYCYFYCCYYCYLITTIIISEVWPLNFHFDSSHPKWGFSMSQIQKSQQRATHKHKATDSHGHPQGTIPGLFRNPSRWGLIYLFKNSTTSSCIGSQEDHGNLKRKGQKNGSTMTFFLGCRKFWSISLPIASVVTVADCIPSFDGYNKNISIGVWRGTSTKSHKSNNAIIVMTGTALDAFWLQLSIFSMEKIMKQMPGYPTWAVLKGRWQKHLHNSPQYEATTKTSRIIYNKYCQHIVILWYTDYKTTFPKITIIFSIFLADC